MSFEQLDQTDRNILALIKNQARMDYTQIGKMVGMSRVSVKNRMDRMEKEGVIKGYHTITDESALPGSVKFFMDIETLPDMYEAVIERLSYDKRVRKIYATTGSCKIHAEGFASSQSDVGYFTRTVFANTKGIVRLRWDILTSVFKDVDGGIDYEGIMHRH